MSQNDAAARAAVVRVHRVEEASQTEIITLSPDYGGLLTHYVREKGHPKGRSRYCDPDGCVNGCPKAERFWRGYFAAMRFDGVARLWVPCVFELSSFSELDMRGRYARGQSWVFTREKNSKNRHAPTTGVFRGLIDQQHVPPAFDFRPVLFHIYNVTSLALGVPNPMPPRLIIEAQPQFDMGVDTPPKEEKMTAAEWQQFRDRLGLSKNGHKK